MLPTSNGTLLNQLSITKHCLKGCKVLEHLSHLTLGGECDTHWLRYHFFAELTYRIKQPNTLTLTLAGNSESVINQTHMVAYYVNEQPTAHHTETWRSMKSPHRGTFSQPWIVKNQLPLYRILTKLVTIKRLNYFIKTQQHFILNIKDSHISF